MGFFQHRTWLYLGLPGTVYSVPGSAMNYFTTNCHSFISCDGLMGWVRNLCKHLFHEHGSANTELKVSMCPTGTRMKESYMGFSGLEIKQSSCRPAEK